MELASDALSVTEQQELSQHETIIQRGLKAFIEVGTALLTIRDNRLYRDYGTFEAYCQKRWKISRPRAYQLMEASEVVSNLSTFVDIPATEGTARPLTELEPDEQRIVWEVVQQTAPNGKVTAAHVKSVVSVFKEVVTTGAIDDGSGEQIKVSAVIDAAITEETYERMLRQKAHISDALNKQNGTPPALQSSQSNEWYTPKVYVEAARTLMGAIDLDPASSDFANIVVRAKRFFTITQDGLKHEWKGRVWLNPPYGREEGDSNQELWSARLLETFKAGKISEAVLLVNAVTDRQWFKPLWDYPICFTDHRIRFYNERGEFGQPTHGNALIYFGTQYQRFVELFSPFGVIAERVLP